MNKYQEALDYIKHDLEHNDFIRYKNGNQVDKYHREVLCKLVDKETPMKPYINDRYCGKCHLVRLLPQENYCSHCGQKIDWSEET